MKIKNFIRRNFALLGFGLASLSVGTMAQAQAFVSASNGADAGNCQLNAPCRNVTYALTQAVEGGTVNVIDSGLYEPFAANKSVTVQAAPGVVAVITRNTAGPGVSIEAQGAEYITIRGLTLNLPNNLFSPGPGFVSSGFNVTGGGTVAIERCVVRGFTVGLNARMIGQLFVRDTHLSGGTTGILIHANYLSLRVSLERCVASRYETGLSVTSVPDAFLRMMVLDSQFSGNVFNVKIAPDASATASVNFEQCTLANGKTGLTAEGAGATVRVSNCTITDNGIGLTANASAALLSRGNNTVEGNSINGNFTGGFLAK